MSELIMLSYEATYIYFYKYVRLKIGLQVTTVKCAIQIHKISND